MIKPLAIVDSALLTSAPKQAGPDDELLIQFVRSQKVGGRAEQVIASLQAVADGDQRVRIHDDFWDDSALTRELAESQRLFLDYDADAYRNKTSGLLWLAAWHRLQVVLPRDTWLEREAIRLGIDWIARDRKGAVTAASPTRPTVDAPYHTALFQPFLTWIAEQH
ncbi:MAG: hypothetical protein R6V12_06030 [Candidatus Hydrogenedentota bacterium]